MDFIIRSCGPLTRKLAWLALPAGLLFLPGCHAALWGNLLMVSVAVGIFVGTLSLGRQAEGRAARSAPAERSQS